MSQADFTRPLSERVTSTPEASAINTARLDRLLQHATRRWRNAKLLAVALSGSALLGAALLIGIFLDAMLGPPGWGVAAIDATLMMIALAVILKLYRTARTTKHDARRTAVAIEQRGAAEPSRLINALDLSAGNDATTDQMSPALRRLAVEQGDAAATTLDPAALVERPARRRALMSFLATAVVFGGAWLTLPSVFEAVGPRLMNPWSGLPAYTTLRFDVTVKAGGTAESAEAIHVGKPGVVEVTLSRTWGNRALPSEADVVVIGGDFGGDSGVGLGEGIETRSLPMHRSYREGEAWPTAVDTTNNPRGDSPAPPTRFSLRFERIEAPVNFYIDTPDGRSPTYTITPDTTPLFESLHVTVTPPDYTGWAAITQRLQVDEAGAKENIVRALPGSAVTLTASSNVPVAEAQLLVSATSRPLVFPGSGDDAAAEALFIVSASSTAQLQLIGQDGEASALTPIAIESLEDDSPTVNIHSPEPLAFAVEGYPVPIRVVAKDDVGLASVKLHLSITGKDADAIELAPSSAGSVASDSQRKQPPFERRVAATHELDLTAMGTQAGDTVRYFATARDHLPFALGGPPNDLGQSAETAVQEIQIISYAQWEEMARMQYGLEQLRAEAEALRAEMDQLAQDRAAIVEQLAAMQEKLESGKALNDMERQQMQDLQDKLDAFAQEAQALAEAMRERAEVPALYEFEEPFKERLKELAEQLEQQAELAEALQEAAKALAEAESSDQEGEPQSSGLPGVTPTQIEEFLEQAQQLAESDEPFDEQTQEQMDELEEDLLRLELAEEMLFHAERIREVIVQQRELERKLGELRFRQADELTPEEAHRLATYGEHALELRDELEDAALMLRESAEVAGPLLPNMSGTSVMLTEKLDRLEVYPDMERTGERAGDVNAGLAHASAQLAADKLESLLSDASSMPSQAESDFGNDPPLSLPKANRQNAMQQMSGARAAGAMMRQMRAGPGQAGRSGGTAGGTNASLIGPRPMGGNASNAGDGREATGESNPANAAAGLAPELGEAQTLNPDSTNSRSRAAISLPGVPARYQDVAAAYFQRLADEATREGQD